MAPARRWVIALFLLPCSSKNELNVRTIFHKRETLTKSKSVQLFHSFGHAFNRRPIGECAGINLNFLEIRDLISWKLRRLSPFLSYKHPGLESIQSVSATEVEEEGYEATLVTFSNFLSAFRKPVKFKICFLVLSTHVSTRRIFAILTR